jgi:hypothetical protein
VSLQVVMKWSLHPVVGPRLTSGQALLDLKELPQEWRELWEAGNAWEWPGIEYRWEVSHGGDDGHDDCLPVVDLWRMCSHACLWQQHHRFSITAHLPCASHHLALHRSALSLIL